MKQQVCITIDRELMVRIRKKLEDGSFRNQSHIFEFAARKFLEEKNDTDL